MEGRDTLRGFDVLVSYNEDVLNDLLQSRAKQLQNDIKLDPWIVDVEDCKCLKVVHVGDVNSHPQSTLMR